ncbi:hypothetical protein [Streptomyces sp. NPDC053728]|uniref:hypothetical protein n=1 Tax=Streptomyces sp. NPDC053728 TaxID=3155534 RepID=UPI003442B95F
MAWGSLTSSYDGKSRSVGYGDYYNSGNTCAKNKVLTKDLSADRKTVYSSTNFQFYGPSSGGTGNGWSSGAYKSTPEHNHTYYVTNYLSTGLDGQSEKSRGAIQVCVQLGFPVADRCSATNHAASSRQTSRYRQVPS